MIKEFREFIMRGNVMDLAVEMCIRDSHWLAGRVDH